MTDLPDETPEVPDTLLGVPGTYEEQPARDDGDEDPDAMVGDPDFNDPYGPDEGWGFVDDGLGPDDTMAEEH